MISWGRDRILYTLSLVSKVSRDRNPPTQLKTRSLFVWFLQGDRFSGVTKRSRSSPPYYSTNV
ncbi:MAG TPA: hypothetical protein V6D48_23045 [Oculatellaceae cyanobacterium]